MATILKWCKALQDENEIHFTNLNVGSKTKFTEV
jgi:hypothetical protein